MRTRTLLTFVVAGGLALGACGGAAENTTSASAGSTAAAGGHPGVVIRDRLVDAASTTMDAGSARISMKMSMAVPGQADAEITAVGLTDFATGDMQMSMDMGPLLGKLAPGAPTGSADSSIELRLVGKVMYMKYPAVLAQGMGMDTPWVSMDLGAALGDLGLSQGSLGQFEQTDPTQYLQYLATVSSDVTEVGHDKLRDVDTTHYHATIDLTKALDRVPADVAQRLGIDPEQLGKSFEQLARAGRPRRAADGRVDRRQRPFAAHAHGDGRGERRGAHRHGDVRLRRRRVGAGSARERGDRPPLDARRPRAVRRRDREGWIRVTGPT